MWLELYNELWYFHHIYDLSDSLYSHEFTRIMGFINYTIILSTYLCYNRLFQKNIHKVHLHELQLFFA